MARPLLDALPLRGARRILDLGCGTGVMLSDIRAAAPRAFVLGIDRAEGMLRVAKQTEAKSVAVADARQLCIRTRSIDAIAMIFVLFHVPDPTECLRDVRRVLKRKGRIGIAVWGNDPGAPGASIWTEELNREGAGPDPREAAVRQMGLMDTPDKLAHLIEQGGLSIVKVWAETMSHRWTFDSLLGYQLACGSAARRLPSLDPDARVRCERRVRERLAQLGESQFDYRPEVLFAVARSN